MADLAERKPDETTEKEFYERFMIAAKRQPGEFESAATSVLRGAGPDPEKAALLRVLLDRDSKRAAELYLLALRELPDLSDSHGESVPSTALLLLDRSAQSDALAREILRRTAFESPRPSPNLRCRAAATFFLHATESELSSSRFDLARESDARFLASALEALSRNPNTELAASMLAPFGRAPSVPTKDT